MFLFTWSRSLLRISFCSFLISNFSLCICFNSILHSLVLLLVLFPVTSLLFLSFHHFPITWPSHIYFFLLVLFFVLALSFFRLLPSFYFWLFSVAMLSYTLFPISRTLCLAKSLSCFSFELDFDLISLCVFTCIPALARLPSLASWSTSFSFSPHFSWL